MDTDQRATGMKGKENEKWQKNLPNLLIGNFIAHSLFWLKLGLVPIFPFRVSSRSPYLLP